MSIWQTTYEIAAARDATKRGLDHLSDNARKILEHFVAEEIAEEVAERAVAMMKQSVWLV